MQQVCVSCDREVSLPYLIEKAGSVCESCWNSFEMLSDEELDKKCDELSLKVQQKAEA